LNTLLLSGLERAKGLRQKLAPLNRSAFARNLKILLNQSRISSNFRWDRLKLVWKKKDSILEMDLGELLAIFGPGIAGAVFGTGWWFWVDAVVCSSVKIPFVHYLPGIFASLAALMFNCVRKDDIDYSPYEEGEWRLKLWLFIAYVVSFVSLAASVGLLIQDALVESGPSAWTGIAGVLQCVFVLISGLIYWISHSE
ncbi:transmembrane protein 50a, partial [Striga asiatica]